MRGHLEQAERNLAAARRSFRRANAYAIGAVIISAVAFVAVLMLQR